MPALTFGNSTVELPTERPTIIGRDGRCDVHVPDERVSRRHAQIQWANGWWIADLGSANGTLLNGQPVRTAPLSPGARIHLGDEPDSPVVTFVEHPAPVQTPPKAPPTGLATIRIGRDPSNDLVVPSLLISRFHARIDRTGHGLVATDLGSFNGTFVNGQQIGRCLLTQGDIIAFGDSPYTLVGGQLREIVTAAGDSFAVEDITFTLPQGKTLLDRISFSLAPGSLTAVIGPSGAGKSTLFRILTGAIAPSAGRVAYEGLDLYEHYAHLRHKVGVVPQDDVIHRQLTVEKALSYAAELRFPPDIGRAALTSRVQATVAELALTNHATTPVARLSGGQRKRTSVAMELLTEPSLLFLDEPTSGLDPGLDKMVMGTLRQLADGGRTVMVITHSVANLGDCDNVLVLGPGGKVAYFGPPSGVLPYFGTTDYADVFTWIAADPDSYQAHFASTRGPVPTPPGSAAAPPAPPPSLPIGRQVWTLARRQVRIMVSDKSYAIFNGILPLVLGLLAMAVPGTDGLGHPKVPSTESMQILVILVVGATFMGMSSSVRDLVGERAIYHRERAVGLSPLGYLSAKVLVFGVLSLLQTAVLLAVVALGKPLSDSAVLLPWGNVELFLALALTAFTGTLAGLLISASVGTSEQVMPLLVVSVMTQLVLCGGLIPVAGRAVLEQLAFLAPARWGYAAAASSVDVLGKLGVPREDALWEHFASTWIFSMLVLLILAGVLGVLTHHRLVERRAPRKRS